MTTERYSPIEKLLILAVISSPIVNFLTGQSSLEDLGILMLEISVVVTLYFVGIHYLHAHRRGPLPWYASPLLWIGLPVLGFILYGLAG